MQLVATLDEYGKPAWITAMIVGFILWWPVGLGVLAYLIWSGRMGCGAWKREWKESDLGREVNRWRRGMSRSGRPATAPSISIARTRCGALRRRSTSFRPSCSGSVTPRTRPSSTSSWPSVGRRSDGVKSRRTPCERATSEREATHKKAPGFIIPRLFVNSDGSMSAPNMLEGRPISVYMRAPPCDCFFPSP